MIIKFGLLLYLVLTFLEYINLLSELSLFNPSGFSIHLGMDTNLPFALSSTGELDALIAN